MPGESWKLLEADVTKARKRCKTLRAGWKYQCAFLQGKYWVNKVFSYGMGSAQLYWGRLAALLLRLIYLFFPYVDWGFVYVDDFAWLIRSSLEWPLTYGILVFLLAAGCPLSWKKTLTGTCNIWLGYMVETIPPSLHVAPDKFRVIHIDLSDITAGIAVLADKIVVILGRLQWATAICPYVKPFLQPLWAWKLKVISTGRPGLLIRTLAYLILFMLQEIHPFPCCRDGSGTWHGATDAGAKLDNDYGVVGGWISDIQKPSTKDVWWFSFRTNPTDHPWA